MLKASPGTGKTTLGLQFLVEGARNREKCLYLGLSETRGQLAVVAKAYGWTPDGIDLHEMRRRGDPAGQRKGYTVFSPSEVELEEISRELLEEIEKAQPARLVPDSLSEIRLLAEDAFRSRRELLTVSDQIAGRTATGLLIDVESRILAAWARRHGGGITVLSSQDEGHHVRGSPAEADRSRHPVLIGLATALPGPSGDGYFCSWTLLRVTRVTSRRSFRLDSCVTCRPITCLARSA